MYERNFFFLFFVLFFVFMLFFFFFKNFSDYCFRKQLLLNTCLSTINFGELFVYSCVC